jgi:hypothetical protein
VLSGEALKTNIIVFGFTRPGLEPTIIIDRVIVNILESSISYTILDASMFTITSSMLSIRLGVQVMDSNKLKNIFVNGGVGGMVFNTTFNNISVISQQRKSGNCA